MRISDTVTIPTELERARVAGELVIFAGAGVSMAPPSNLPSFVGLARQIGETTLPLTAEDEKALDRYLGRVERLGVRVQQRARETLAERGGEHARAHEDLLSLFHGPEQIRLITTNFDPHFATASRVVFSSARIPLYVGPALPPGSQFRGIVQLHGALAETQDRLVLTDGDFAAAYMAEGWAARFLVGVFPARTILFVGYSLSDPVMQYLLRALPTNDRWYALCHEDESAHWIEHRVIPVPYGTRPDGDRHADLYAALKRWRWYATASPTDHDRELRRIIAAGPPASLQEADYARARLQTDAGRDTFWRAASDVAWFRWASSEGLLDPLTDLNGGSSTASQWAHWCLSHFLSGENPPFLQFMRRRTLGLHPHVAFQIVLHLWRADALPPRSIVRQLVTLIINQPARRGSGVEHYDWLLQKLVTAGFHEEAVALLGWMTQLRLEPVERFYMALEDEDGQPEGLPPLATRVGTVAPPSVIADFLMHHGSSLAAAVGDRLVDLGMSRIVQAYELLDLAWGQEERRFDVLSFGRTAIAPSNQDRSHHTEDVLVLLVRAALDHWRDSEPENLHRFGSDHSRNRRALVRRLALYAIEECSTVPADDSLDRATAERWAVDYKIRPEFYQVLKKHFIAASEQAKERFIASLRDDTTWGSVDEHQAHARFSISQLLYRIAPQSAMAGAFSEAERRAQPKWREQDPDGFLSRLEVSWGGELPSPIDSTELLTLGGADALERLLTELAQPRDENMPLLGAVQQATKTNPPWGINLLVAISQSHDPASARLAEGIVWGLRDSAVSVDDQLMLLEFMSAWEWPEDITRSVASLLEKLARDSDGTGNLSLLDALDGVADRVYARAQTMGSAILGEVGWTERAINHPAGHAAEVWWNTALARNRTNGQFVLSISDDERARWSRVLEDESSAGAHARVILGMASDRLTAGDFPWARERLFPAFDPTNGRERAAQLWDGRLSHSRFYWPTILGLAASLPVFFRDSASLTPARSEQLGDFVALLITHPEESSFSLTGLHQFVRGATLEARRAFAHAVPRHLAALEANARQQLWQGTLRPYWRDRRTGVPVALDEGEVAAMLRWIVELPEVAADAVVELNQTLVEGLEHADHIVWEWREDPSWLRAHPREACSILKWLADRRAIEPWTANDIVTLLQNALDAGAERELVLAAAESLAALPSQLAIAFVENLRREAS
jgi:hypothetical protein